MTAGGALGMERPVRITDHLMPELDIFARLNEPQLKTFYEPEPGLFLAETAMVAGRALDAGYEPEALLVEDTLLQPAAELIRRCGDIPVYTASAEVLRQVTGYPLTRGVLLAMRRKALPPARELCRDARRIAVLEHVTNPTNVGAVFRSAAALGMDAVLLTEDCSDPLYRRAVRVSVGTVFRVPWTYIPDIGSLRGLGFRCAALALREDALSITDPRLQEEETLALVLGSEGYGLTEETIRTCDYAVRIPMREGVDSLNVAAAAAVAFWELGRTARKGRR